MSPDELDQRRDRERDRQEGLHERLSCCVAAGCIASGAEEVRRALAAEVRDTGLAGRIEIAGTGCMGRCGRGPVVRSQRNGAVYTGVRPADVPALLGDGQPAEQAALAARRIPDDDPFYARQTRIVLENAGHVDPEGIATYLARDGWQGLARALHEFSPREVISEIKASGLRGRGGAGYPTGVKWELVAKQPSTTKFVICNADEGDPGAFMDRSVLEGDPQRLLEGMAIAGYAVGARQGFIYVRGEYGLPI
jgi:bidirectional [NiFe] hydrogenase diaphorase subunit